MQKISYNNTEFTIPSLDNRGGYRLDLSGLKPTPAIAHGKLQRTTLDELNTVWDLRRFGKARLPVSCGVVADRTLFSYPSELRILDMPIKFPNTDYRFPRACAQFATDIMRIAVTQMATNPHLHDSQYAYLTIDQLPVRKGETQRKPGLHVDGFQGARVKEKLLIDQSYIVSDKFPTVFYGHSFDVSHLDEAVHNFFLEFDEQADEGATWRPDPYEICLINAYQVHRADIATEDSPRTFFRLSYTLREFDRLGNTHNPLFDYSWKMVPRDTQTTLVKASGRRF